MTILTIAISASLLLLQAGDINAPITPTQPDQAGVIYWDGGTMIYAHNYLAGGLLYELKEGDIITATFEDGREREYVLMLKRVIEPDRWHKAIVTYSSPNTLTFVTCWPEFPAPQQGNLIVQFAPLEKDKKAERFDK